MTSAASPETLLQLAFAHTAARALHVVAELGLPEYDALLAAAGLELLGVTPTATPFSLVEARIR